MIEIHGLLRHRRTPNLSSEQALKRILGRRRFCRIERETPDKREIYAEAAKSLSISEDELMRRLAKILGLPYLPALGPIDSRHVELVEAIGAYAKLGAAPVFREGTFMGVACLDPERVRGALLDPSVPYFVSSWTAIREALRKSKERQRAGTCETNDPLVERVVGVLVDQVSRHGADEVVIVQREGALTYSFITDNGRTGKGEVAPQLRSALISFLESAAAGKEVTAGNGARATVTVSVVDGHYHLRVGCRTSETRRKASPPSERVLPPPAARLIAFPGPAKDEDTPAPTPFVLLVDDHAMFGEVLKTFFRKAGFDTAYAENGEAALASLSERVPDVIVCDLHMPVMDGEGFFRTLKGHDTFKDIPFVLLTSDEDVESELSLVESGVDAFLRKSEDSRLLVAHVQRLLEQKGKAPKRCQG